MGKTESCADLLACGFFFHNIKKYVILLLVLPCNVRNFSILWRCIYHSVFPLTHNKCEVVISWWSPLLPKISIYATKCESILEKSGIFIHLQSKYCINLSCNKANLRDLIAVTGLVILLKFDPIHRFFSLCDLEIWWMTLENNRAPLLYYIKLCASFHTHWWIQISVTVRKRSIRVKIDNFLSRVT